MPTITHDEAVTVAFFIECSDNWSDDVKVACREQIEDGWRLLKKLNIAAEMAPKD